MAETVWAHCNRCLGRRRHELLHAVVDDWVDEEADYSGSDTYEMLRCRGCEQVTLRHRSQLWDDAERDSKPHVKVVYYPPALSRRAPEWLYALRTTLPPVPFANAEQTSDFSSGAKLTADLLTEIYAALQNDSRRLAVMGIRTLLEVVMVTKVGDHGSFGKNLTAFQAAGYVSKAQADVLQMVLEAGHATVHRAYEPKAETVEALIDIAESVVESVYVHPRKVNELRGTIPPRPSARKGNAPT